MRHALRPCSTLHFPTSPSSRCLASPRHPSSSTLNHQRRYPLPLHRCCLHHRQSDTRPPHAPTSRAIPSLWLSPAQRLLHSCPSRCTSRTRHHSSPSPQLRSSTRTGLWPVFKFVRTLLRGWQVSTR